jgi:hypothetical protein
VTAAPTISASSTLDGRSRAQRALARAGTPRRARSCAAAERSGTRSTRSSRARTALQKILSEQLPRLCELAIAQAASGTDLELLLGDSTLAAALQRAVGTVAVNADVLPNVVGAFPPRADLVLNPLVLALTQQQTMHSRQLAQADSATHAPDVAMSLNNLSVRLAEAAFR